MANFASLLKAEISRIARKEIQPRGDLYRIASIGLFCSNTQRV